MMGVSTYTEVPPIMTRQLWRDVSAAINRVAKNWPREDKRTHTTARVVRIYLWSVVNHRPVYWACDRDHWVGVKAPTLPSQSTMSRRLAHDDTERFLLRLLDALAPNIGGAIQAIDGKPLIVSRHSQDAEATFGRGAGGKDRGYKLHAVYANALRPTAFRVMPLNVDERVVGRELLAELAKQGQSGYVLGDANYDSNPLHAVADAGGLQLVTPRRRGPGRGTGHRRQTPGRLRNIALLEGQSDFGRELYEQRRGIESCFGHLTSGGLWSLPPWVRTLRRVRLWVTAHILLRAARQTQINRQRAA